MRVLGISGSPRLGGNTDNLLLEMLKGSAEAGAETKMLHICDYDIEPCNHCSHCYTRGECRIADDMLDIYEEIEKADIIILASPLHFMSVTAQLKAFIDRGQSHWARKYVLNKPPFDTEKKRKGFFISVGGRTGSSLFDAAKVTIKAWFASHNIEYTGELTFEGMDAAGDILKTPEALKQSYEEGRKLAKT